MRIYQQQLLAAVGLVIALQFAVPRVAAESAPEMHANFELLGADGAVVTASDLRGRYVLLGFGFTQCEHICPMMAANMGQALRMSGQEATGVFISVDSERDSPEVTDAYAKQFGEQMIGLSGSYPQLVAAARNFNVTFVVTKSDVAYSVQHTPNIYLIDPEGVVVDVFPLNAPAKRMAEAMR